MPRPRFHAVAALTALFVCALIAAGCGDDDDETTTTTSAGESARAVGRRGRQVVQRRGAAARRRCGNRSRERVHFRRQHGQAGPSSAASRHRGALEGRELLQERRRPAPVGPGSGRALEALRRDRQRRVGPRCVRARSMRLWWSAPRSGVPAGLHRAAADSGSTSAVSRARPGPLPRPPPAAPHRGPRAPLRSGRALRTVRRPSDGASVISLVRHEDCEQSQLGSNASFSVSADSSSLRGSLPSITRLCPAPNRPGGPGVKHPQAPTKHPAQVVEVHAQDTSANAKRPQSSKPAYLTDRLAPSHNGQGWPLSR